MHTSSKLALLACYLRSNRTRFSCCSLITPTPTFSVGHFYQRNWRRRRAQPVYPTQKVLYSKTSKQRTHFLGEQY